MFFICAAVGKTESQEIERVMHGMHGPKKKRTANRKMFEDRCSCCRRIVDCNVCITLIDCVCSSRTDGIQHAARPYRNRLPPMPVFICLKFLIMFLVCNKSKTIDLLSQTIHLSIAVRATIQHAVVNFHIVFFFFFFCPYMIVVACASQNRHIEFLFS